ncbi:MAG TPA: phosphate acyltransferase PlsX [Gemmatimonadales bacterium]|nr:phosphate acyltransferase PlsX [Gemmatimonadales bacterium]
MIRVALDAMGGDHAPAVEIEGARMALRDLPPTFVVQLVGQTEVIERELGRHPGIDRDRVEIVEAPDVIGMGEKPLAAIRKKPRSSLVVGLGLQASGRSEAFISAGNTGAVLAGSTVMLGLHHGVERASVATMFPTAHGPCLVLAGGANVDCSARELSCFARLGSVYMRDVMGVAEPTVGLLNVGEEDEKGGAVVREAFTLLRQTPGLHFVGNIEGRDILAGHSRAGHVDVAVCDGFVGNILLKFYESVGGMLHKLLHKGDPELLRHPEIVKAFEFLDYSQYGGAPLLGVRGISIICHGASPSNAIKHAIRVATHSVEVHLDQHIGAEFARGTA